MITTTDIGDILFRDCQTFGLDVFRKGNIPDGDVVSERIVIIPKPQTPNKYWKKSFIEVNFCVPYLVGQKAALARLGELERNARMTLNGVTGEYDGTRYRYSISSVGVEEDTLLKCYYVNVRLLFQTLNVR